MAASRESARVRPATGPKISSRPIDISGVTPSKTVGPNQWPAGEAAARAVTLALVDITRNPVPVRGGNDRPHRHRGIEPVTQCEIAGPIEDGLAHRTIGLAHTHDDAARETA